MWDAQGVNSRPNLSGFHLKMCRQAPLVSTLFSALRRVCDCDLAHYGAVILAESRTHCIQLGNVFDFKNSSLEAALQKISMLRCNMQCRAIHAQYLCARSENPESIFGFV